MAASMKRGVMASRSSSSSSESSEDDQTQPDEKRRRLQDAAVTLDYLSNLERWGKSSKTGDSPMNNNLPSKRCADVNEHEDENPLRTTPEFKAFVSKKLSEKLEREIEFCATEAPTSQYASWVSQDLSIAQEGVRLFSDSCHDLSHVDEAPSQPKKPQKPRHPPHRAYSTASDGYSCKAERLAAVAVTADFLAQERVMWARLSQASQESTEKQASTSTSTTADKVTLNHTTNHEDTRKKKKKKKKVKETGGTDGGNLDTNTATEECCEKREKDCGKKRKRGADSQSSVSASEKHTDQKPSSDMSDINGEEREPVKKKKKNDDVSKKSVTDIEDGSCDEPQRKKKKKKRKDMDRNMCNISDTNGTEESHSVEARGGGVRCAQQTEKKKHKKHHR